MNTKKIVVRALQFASRPVAWEIIMLTLVAGLGWVMIKWIEGLK